MTKNRVFHSLIWSVVKNWGGRLTTLLVFTLLTRLLDARDIGAVAFISAIIVVLVAVAEMGLAEYLIYKDDSPAARNQIFWFQVYVGVGLFALSLVAGPPLLRHFGQHDAAAILPYLGLLMPLTALAAVQDALQRKALQFKAIALRSLIGMLAGAVVGVGLALWGAGMWSLVFKQLAETLVTTVLVWRMSDWRPRWRCEWTGFYKVFDYGRYMAGGRMLDVLTQNIDDMIVGIAVGQQQLGFYSIGKKLYAISNELLAGVTMQIAGPLLATAQGDRKRLWSMFLEAFRYSAWLIIPLYVALYFFAPRIVPMLFGQQWTGAVWILQTFCVVGMLFPFYQFNWPLIMASGQAAHSFRYSLVRNVGGIAILIGASFFGWQVFVMAQIARIAFNIGAGWVFLRGVITFNYGELGRAALPGLAAAVLAGTAFYLLTWAMGNIFLVQAAGVALVLSAAYLLMLKNFKRGRKAT